ncbi:MAG: dephospho-CoA kinase [Paracoccaceae bacterium]
MSRRPYLLGLTGSIGMGKSTTAALFAQAGVPVWDADGAVAELYAAGGAGTQRIAQLAPEAVGANGVDRAVLRREIQNNPALLAKIETAIHPLVAQSRAQFLALHKNAPLVLFDVPLLFETGAENWLDGVLVVSTAPEIQRARVLGREGMSAEFLDNILSRQMPNAEKRARADWVFDTGHGIEPVRKAVLALVATLNESARHA